MKPSTRTKLAICLIAAFLGGVAVTIFVARVATWTGAHVFPMEYEEIARQTSPDGKVDAVMIRSNCGAPCSFGYSVSVVPIGVRPSTNPQKGIFYAEDMTEAKLTWKQSHLLKIGYKKALIYELRNISYPLAESGATEGDWTYKVEIQLEPLSSTGFSYLEAKDLQ